MENPCNHPKPENACFEYRHITCSKCGKIICAGCQSFDPKNQSELTPVAKSCLHCGGTGLEP